MSNRIGIMGGSFDPIHSGHLIIALDAVEQFELEKVLFVPAYQAPLKSKSPSASAEARMKMVELATSDEDRFQASDVDYQCKDTSYSVRTARNLKKEFPEAELFWILGADQIAQLHLWRDIEELARVVSFIAFDRPGSKNQTSGKMPEHTRLLLGEPRPLQISSTEIRDRLKSHRGAKYFLPAKVFDYIKAENLYI
ncbi:nicotinate-nucleotide adenylyltransferase [Pelagicoccus albus]|uniref:Probable nicotinate-nucleotide adenylyltransferase n=1 Tax=Pelagicoccus albus TaxID=415222 RepID=A0A7X1B6B6_9BACT|nr:nicotinate-nucleotide adenylyltransferase [Pelagicoccus albus]